MPRILGDTSNVPGDKLEVTLLGEVEGTGHWTPYRNRVFSWKRIKLD
jgi:hypothetical protein